MQSQRILLSFTGRVGEPPTLIDLMVELSPDHAANFDIDSVIQWSLQNDEVPRSTVSVDVLNTQAPVQVFRKSILRSETDDKTCAICCEPFKPRKHVRRLPCGHMFCSKCISKWVVRQSATCPTCRCTLEQYNSSE